MGSDYVTVLLLSLSPPQPGLEPGILCTQKHQSPSKHHYPKAATLGEQGKHLLQGLRASEVTD
jgi:hypothetical protein